MTLLKRGSAGPLVEALHEDLDTIGSEVDDDGTYGPKTEAAIRALQAAAGLVENGIAGPETLAKLAELVEEAEDDEDDDEDEDGEEGDDEDDEEGDDEDDDDDDDEDDDDEEEGDEEKEDEEKEKPAK